MNIEYTISLPTLPLVIWGALFALFQLKTVIDGDQVYFFSTIPKILMFTTIQ